MRSLLVHVSLLVLAMSAQASPEPPVVRVLWSCDIPVPQSRSAPLLLDSCASLDGGGLLVTASRWHYGIPSACRFDLWSIEAGPGGEPCICKEETLDGAAVISASMLDPSTDEQFLLAVSSGGDTLWTCRLEGTDEFCHSPRLFGLHDGGCAACVTPDCNENRAGIFRISAGGDCLFSSWIEHWWLLGMPETPGEAGPRIASACLDPSGNLLLAGEVSEWMTTPLAWFVCLLDGTTGEPVWRASGFGLGQAFLSDAVTTDRGLTVAVGTTARCTYEDGPVPGWDARRPMIVLLGPSGEILQTVVLEGGPAGALEGIAECPDAPGSFVAAMSPDDSDRMVLMGIEMPGDPAAWVGSVAADVDGWPGYE